MSDNKTDKIVLELLEKVKLKQAEITASSRPQWETSCTIGFNLDTVNDRVNIQTITDINRLVYIHSKISNLAKGWNESAKSLGVTEKFKWLGYPLDAWLTDIKNRVNQLNVNTKKKELAVLEERINKLITVDQRRVLELEAIQKELGTD